MAKKAVIQPTQRIKIMSAEFIGIKSEMPQEAKDALLSRNPKTAMLFK